MKKITLIDGNSLMFRAFYATYYTGKMMQTSQGLYTNAIYGFVNMINSLLEKKDINYVFVAFDAGKQTFRHQEYKEYKGTRTKLPEELKVQIPYIKEYLDVLEIKHFESLEYEADDLIATMANLCKDKFDEIHIVSGDKDLLQLVDDKITVHLTKSGVKELDENNISNFKEKNNIYPNQVTDYKGLIGDSSDNLPGIRGIGPKTAIQLLTDYKDLEDIYLNIEEVKGRTKTLLEGGKEEAYKTKYLATLVKDAYIPYEIEDLNYQNYDHPKLYRFYKEMEFNSLMKQSDQGELEENPNLEIIEDLNYDFSKLDKEITLSLETYYENYYNNQILGLAIKDKKHHLFVSKDVLSKNKSLHEILANEETKISLFDYKKTYVLLKKRGINLKNVTFDLLLAAYLINPSYSNDDIQVVAQNFFETSIPHYDTIYKENKKYHIPSLDIYSQYAAAKNDLINKLKKQVLAEIKENEIEDLFKIEIELSKVLGDMEICGLLIDPLKLKEIGEEFEVEASKYQDEVFMYAGEKFNLNSYKVLGEILFEKLKLPVYKKTKTGYSTNSEVLEKLAYRYPIAKAILEYRSYNKLITTYVNGLLEVKDENNYLHPVYKQALTTTGRLSSIEPNIQNIPIRTETGQTIRKVFVSRFKDGLILSADYSQIELRVLASLSEDPKMIEFYNQGLDIHRATAASIYGIDYNMINSSQRRDAKTINFGIIYGMSAWGLSEALNINPKDASDYIERYFEIFKGAKEFLDNQVANAREKGYTKTLLNRRRYIDNINSPNINLRNFGERTAMNAPIQGTAADIIKLAMNKVKAKMVEAKLESLLIAQVHDELVFDVKPNELEVLKDIVKTEMENVIKLNVPLVIEINYGKNWYETK